MVHEWARCRKDQDSPLCEEQKALASPRQVSAQTCLSSCRLPRAPDDYRTIAREFEEAKLMANRVSHLLNREISDGDLSQIREGRVVEKRDWLSKDQTEARRVAILCTGVIQGMVAIGSASPTVAGVVAGIGLGYLLGKGGVLLTDFADRALRRRCAEERIGLKRREPAFVVAEKERKAVIDQLKRDEGFLIESRINEGLSDRSEYLRGLALKNDSRARSLLQLAEDLEFRER